MSKSKNIIVIVVMTNDKISRLLHIVDLILDDDTDGPSSL